MKGRGMARDSMKGKDLPAWLRVTWVDFSIMIRVEAADRFGLCQCVTCDLTAHWRSGLIQAGHFLAYRYPNSPVRFVENNVHCQCKHDNTDGYASIPHPGAVAKRENVQMRYMTYMIKTYGLEEVERLQTLRSTGLCAKGDERIDELRVMRAEYKQRAAKAIEEKGL